jgi:hypothetical protein
VTDDKICPICQLNSKPEWAACCEWCWNFIGWIDELYGTDYQKRLAEKKPVVIWERLVVYHITTYYPLTHRERKEKIKELARKFCNKCLADISKDCSKCWVHWMMNEINGNGN